jgi:short subunit dehydrogenase-like uncharacterized protein
MGQAGEFDVIVYGASGYTGQLVAEVMAGRYGASSGVSWALAGRNLDKLAAVRGAVGAPASVALVAADGDDEASLLAMAQRAKVVLTTVGPYQLYGSKLVEACAKTGTDYVDLCGEPAWMRQMIDAHEGAAKASGARIVFSCGFDSIPFDLGVYFLQQQAKARFGQVCGRVRGRVRKMAGTFSGGTAASLKATMAAAMTDPNVITLLRSPFALTPGFEGPEQPHGMSPMQDDALDGLWVAPFIMAPINTKNVHRSNALLQHMYGRDFVYDEMLITGPGAQGEAIAKHVAGDRSLMSDGGPKPGEGPSKEERESGHYDVLFLGETSDGRRIKVGVTGDMDPGYGSTSKMIAEAAVCLAKDDVALGGGIFTAAPVMADALIKRLVANAGLTFAVED